MAEAPFLLLLVSICFRRYLCRCAASDSRGAQRTSPLYRLTNTCKRTGYRIVKTIVIGSLREVLLQKIKFRTAANVFEGLPPLCTLGAPVVRQNLSRS
jgi:hypothetical protein